MARVFFTFLLVVYSSIGANKEIDILIEKGWEYYEKGEFIKMENTARKVLTKSIKLNYHKGIAEGYYYLGIAYYSQGKKVKALEYARKALEYSDKYDNYRWKAYALTLSGEILRSLKRYDEALSQFRKAVNLIMENNNRKMLPVAYGNIGNIYYEKGDFKKAVEYYKKGLDIGRRLNIRKSYIALNGYNLALTYYRMKKYRAALPLLEEARKVYNELGDTKSELIAVYYIAKSYMKAGEKDRAYTILKKYYQKAKKSGLGRPYRKLLEKLEKR